MKNIILTGLMGAGKSTIGRALAKRRRMEFFDSDRLIEERTGVDIPTIFEIEGEEGFRDREQQVIADLVAEKGVVIAIGGGSLIREANRNLLTESGILIYLRATPQQLYSRIRYDKSRPLMQTDNPLQTLTRILKNREKYYLDTADLIIRTGKHRVNVTIKQIENGLNQLGEGH
ncbi:MAG: shikimate kinase [Thiotrichaceae bacterium]